MTNLPLPLTNPEPDSVGTMGIYTPIEEVRDEIWRRWHDEALQKEVERYLCDIPKVFTTEPRAVFPRYVISFNNELIRFLSLAQEVGLKPLGWEYCKDIFVARNPEKKKPWRTSLAAQSKRHPASNRRDPL